jgi:hypothetical protein
MNSFGNLVRKGSKCRLQGCSGPEVLAGCDLGFLPLTVAPTDQVGHAALQNFLQPAAANVGAAPRSEMLQLLLIEPAPPPRRT